MMTNYYQADQVLQIILLVLSQLTVITLASGFILLFKRGCEKKKQVGVAALFFLNAMLYVWMQLNSHITGAEINVQLQVPCVVLLAVILLSLFYNIRVILGETKDRKTLSRTSIKEAFDNLPTGVCFFNEMGLPVLCNLAMNRFSFAVCGKDVQFITDLEGCLSDDFVPVTGVKKEDKVFVFPNDSAWHLEKRNFTHENGENYTQFIVTDVTQLHEKRVELQRENEQLWKVQNDLKRLSANVVTVTREEEILNTKMRVHDEMGRCLIEARRYLREDVHENIPDSVVLSWQRAVSMLKYNNDTPEEDMLEQIRKTCKHVNLDFVQTGTLPEQENVAYILTCAVRECVTNAVRYAGASEIYAVFSENEMEATVVVTNSGKQPESEIVEGGGLSTLRRRVERAGGSMKIRSFPYFELTVTIPKEKEGIS